MEAVLAHPDARGLTRFVLLADDAHGLGSEPLDEVRKWMRKRR